MSHRDDHYGGKDALGHLLDARSKGYSAGSEPHGIEASGIWHSFCDSAKMTAVACIFLLLIANFSSLSLPHMRGMLGLSFGWALWMGGRSSWLAFTRIDRLLNAIAEEKHEVDNNRSMEKEELREIYELKGFEGKLLDDVVDVLASDNNRLLEVMLEEELGIKKQCQDHPLLQGFSAFASSALVGTASLALYDFFGLWSLALPAASYLAAAIGSAYLFGISILKSAVWQLGIALVSAITLYFALMHL